MSLLIFSSPAIKTKRKRAMSPPKKSEEPSDEPPETKSEEPPMSLRVFCSPAI